MTPRNDPTTLICAALYGAILSVFAVAMYLDPYLWARIFGSAGYLVYYYFVIVSQPVAYLINIIGATMLVRWLAKRSNQSMQPTASPRTTSLSGD